MYVGIQKIDCQYCYDGVCCFKYFVIFVVNICMNCYCVIKVGFQYGIVELIKIYVFIGYDFFFDIYFDNYEEMNQDDIEKVYKKWIVDIYVKENGFIDSKGEEFIEEQWEGIVFLLINLYKKKIQGFIEWVCIYNLLDYVYFNYVQYVMVGQLECQICYGLMEEWEVVKQYFLFFMGWCINCYCQMEVQFDDNEYYKFYICYYEEIVSGECEKVMVEDIGGFECQKCYY